MKNRATQDDSGHVSSALGVVIMGTQALVVAAALVTIAGMLGAAIAFTHEVTISIPLIATFRGFSEAGGSAAVAISGSWGVTVAFVTALAVMITAVALRVARRVGATSGDLA